MTSKNRSTTAFGVATLAAMALMLGACGEPAEETNQGSVAPTDQQSSAAATTEQGAEQKTQ